MADIICYLCKENRVCQEWQGPKMLDEDGGKPCFECLLEAGVFDDEEEADA